MEQACGSLILGKTFDNGVICAAEQSVVVVKDVYDQFKTLLEDRGVFFLYGEDRKKLGEFMYNDLSINSAVVGQTALSIADLCNVGSENIPSETLVLGTEESNDDIGEEFPFSKEKLSPVLSMFKADSFEEAVSICGCLARNGGVGHSAGLYTSSIPEEANRREQMFVENVPVGRVFVNAPTSLTAIGSAFNFEVDPSFTLGVGTQAGSSMSSNLGPMHLINTVTVAERQDHMEWFNLPQKVYFNRGCLEEGLRQCAKPRADGQLNERVLIVSDKVNQKLGYVDRVASKMKELGFEVDVFLDVNPDPDMVCIRKGVAACESFRPDIMVCLGGGRCVVLY